MIGNMRSGPGRRGGRIGDNVSDAMDVDAASPTPGPAGQYIPPSMPAPMSSAQQATLFQTPQFPFSHTGHGQGMESFYLSLETQRIQRDIQRALQREKEIAEAQRRDMQNEMRLREIELERVHAQRELERAQELQSIRAFTEYQMQIRALEDQLRRNQP